MSDSVSVAVSILFRLDFHCFLPLSYTLYVFVCVPVSGFSFVSLRPAECFISADKQCSFLSLKVFPPYQMRCIRYVSLSVHVCVCMRM